MNLSVCRRSRTKSFPAQNPGPPTAERTSRRIRIPASNRAVPHGKKNMRPKSSFTALITTDGSERVRAIYLRKFFFGKFFRSAEGIVSHITLTAGSTDASACATSVSRFAIPSNEPVSSVSNSTTQGPWPTRSHRASAGPPYRWSCNRRMSDGSCNGSWSEKGFQIHAVRFVGIRASYRLDHLS